MQNLIVALKLVLLKLSKKGEHVMHATYLGLVYVEAHSNYRYAAGLLLVCILINALAGEE